MTQRHLLVFTFLVSFVLNAYSAIELRSTQMRTSDGLPNNSIRYIYQDSKGFLWLATLNGLSRYDGNSFLTFRPEAGDKVSLADNRIYDLTEDKDGFLWISTTPELYSCYDLQRARFVDYTGCGELRQNYSTVFVTANGDVWLSHQGNGCRRMVHQKNGEMTSTVFRTECGNLPDNRVKFVNEDAGGRIWIGTQCGLVSVSVVVTNQFALFNIQTWISGYFSGRKIISIYSGRSQNHPFIFQQEISGRRRLPCNG